MQSLGFQSQVYRESLYFNDHEKPDVIMYWNKFLSDFAELPEQLIVYTGDNLEVASAIHPVFLE